MPERCQDTLPNSSNFVGLPGKNIKIAQANAPHTDNQAHCFDGAPLSAHGRSRSKSPLGITVDTSVGRNGAPPQLLKTPSPTHQANPRRRSSMLLIPSFEPDMSKVSRRKDAPTALQLETSLSPSDRDVPLVLSAATPEFLRLNSKHGKQHRPTLSALDQYPPTGGLQSAPPIIVLTPTEPTPPISPPRRTRTAPPKPPRSSSIYTRNTRLFNQFQTPRVGNGATPALPKPASRFRLTSFSPMSLMSGTTIFEDESPIDPEMHASPSVSTRRNTDLSLETIMATPLRKNGWWDILTPISPQVLARSFTAPARLLNPSGQEDQRAPSLEHPQSAVHDLPRDFNENDRGLGPTALTRKATQRTIPTIGEAAEYYDPTKSFEDANQNPVTDRSVEVERRGEPDSDPRIATALEEVRSSPTKHRHEPIPQAVARQESMGKGLKSTPLNASEKSSPASSQRKAPALRSAFQTPKPFVQSPNDGYASQRGTSPLEFSSPPVISEAALAHFHAGEEIHPRDIQRFEDRSAETHVMQAHANQRHESFQETHYRGFSGVYAPRRTLSSTHDYENAYRAPSPNARTAQQTSPRIRHLRDPSTAEEGFPGHEKAIAMGMDKPANYQMHDVEARSWEEKAPSSRNLRYDVPLGRPARQPWMVWFQAPRFIGDRGPMTKRGRFALIGASLLLLVVVILSVSLAMTLSKKPADMPIGVQWLNLTNMPPLPTGIATVVGPHEKSQTSCVAVQGLWSCSMPKEQQYLIQGARPTTPNFRLELRYLSSLDKAAGGKARKTQKRDEFQGVIAQAAPSPPSINDRAFLGNTTDQVQPFEGEQTPFIMSILPLTQVTVSNAAAHANAKRGIPNAPLAINKTAAPASLYPEVSAQPLYLYNRGLDTEHYGFSAYFTKSTFLSLPNGTASLNGTISSPGFNTSNSVSSDGGAPRNLANTYCIWPQTRIHVRMWTRQGAQRNVQNPGNSSASAVDFKAPGSLPLPITIELDRHGGSAGSKGVACWDIDSQGKIDDASRTVVPEDRGSDGNLVNAAPAPFEDVQVAKMGGWGGVDGGTGGCGCSWTNS